MRTLRVNVRADSADPLMLGFSRVFECMFEEEARKWTSAQPCWGSVLRVSEKIPHFNSLETINHHIDSEAAWLSAITGNLQ